MRAGKGRVSVDLSMAVNVQASERSVAFWSNHYPLIMLSTFSRNVLFGVSPYCGFRCGFVSSLPRSNSDHEALKMYLWMNKLAPAAALACLVAAVAVDPGLAASAEDISAPLTAKTDELIDIVISWGQRLGVLAFAVFFVSALAGRVRWAWAGFIGIAVVGLTLVNVLSEWLRSAAT